MGLGLIFARLWALFIGKLAACERRHPARFKILGMISSWLAGWAGWLGWLAGSTGLLGWLCKLAGLGKAGLIT